MLKSQRKMVETGGWLFQLLGLSELAGQIYGLLYFSTHPLTLDEISRLLHIGKGTASSGTRELLRLYAVKEVTILGDRRCYFEAVAELEELLDGTYDRFVKPRLNSAAKRIDSMNDGLDAEFRDGLLTKEEFDLFRSRFQALSNFSQALSMVTPYPSQGAERVMNPVTW